MQMRAVLWYAVPYCPWTAVYAARVFLDNPANFLGGLVLALSPLVFVLLYIVYSGQLYDRTRNEIAKALNNIARRTALGTQTWVLC